MGEKLSKPRCVVLVVEDEPFVRLLGADLLEEAGYAVLQACDGDEAMHLLEYHPEVNVVFTDIEMPGSIDGVGLARLVRERWPRIGLILTSGHRLRTGALPREESFLAKPYSGKTLVRKIEEIIC